ncbi:MAG: ABC transporter ATP-binding protein/permease, partial [Gammaproteobacteria bacterium]|nr:ABC transporter ATP-binding protein/permease [Gammaproteobacteria bacterium]
GYFGFWLITRARTTMMRDLMTTIHRHLIGLPLAYFNNARAGDLVSRMTNDVARTVGSLDTTATGVLKSGTQILITMFIILRTDAWLALGVVALGGVHILISRMLAKRVRYRSAGSVRLMGDMQARFTDSVSAIRAVKAFGAERAHAKSIYSLADEHRDWVYRQRMATYFQTPLRMVADSVVLSALLVIVFYSVAAGTLTQSGAVFLIVLLQQATGPTAEFFRQYLSFQELLGNAERVLEVLKTESELKDGEREPQALEREIRLENVSFQYRPDSPVLKNVNLTVGHGEFIGIAGPSGSGKTTLADLILRLFDATDGKVLYDGVDVREFRQRDYRRYFGMVSQDTLLINDTLANNIIFYREFDQQRLEHAMWVANVSEFLEDLPEGLETLVGDRGVRLSGGQRQRVAIARSVYAKPSILILDEATSALDTENERLVQEAVERIAKEMTTIVIAHRLSTIARADRIVVLKDGVVEAAAPHEELLELSPTYQRLHELQQFDRAPVPDA